MDGWTPKKLEIALNFDSYAVVDLDALKSQGPQDGEVSLPDESAVEELQHPNVDQSVVKMLVEFGVPEIQAVHAVYNTGSRGPDMAIEWFYQHIDDPSIQVPLKVKKQSGKEVKQQNPESIMIISSMGFTEKQASRALSKCDGNLERACDWIFSHIDDPPSDEEPMQVDHDNSQSI